jgi:chitodextrinase
MRRLSSVRVRLRAAAVLAGVTGITALMGLVLPGSAQAATPSFVQVVAAVPQSNQASVSVAYSKTQTAGNTNILAIGWADTTSSITGVTDSKGNTYSVAVATTRGSTQSQAIYYAKNIAGAAANANTVTVTFNTPARFVDLRASEYSGLDAVAPLDKTASASGTAATAVTPSVTTSFGSELIFGAGDTSGVFSSAGTGFTKRIITKPDSDITLDENVSLIGSYNVSAKGNGAWVLQMATFKAAGATPDTTPPSVPQNLTAAAASQTQVNLSWSASTDNIGVTGYRVFRNGTQVATPTGTSFSDTGLSPATTYTYNVAAVDAAGNTSAQSSSASATTQAPDTTPPSTPQNLTATPVSGSEIDLDWAASTDDVGVTGYRVYRNATLLTTVTTTTFKNTGLTAGTTYTYAVSAIDASGNESAQSSTVNATTQAGPSFAFPVAISANHRYLLDQHGNPYMIVGDSPHSLIVNLTEAQADQYFADRQAHGVNSAWIQVLCDSYTGGRPNGATYDGIIPFTTPNDFSTPNPAYFQRVVDMVNIAAQHGVTVFLDAMDTAGWQSQYESNGQTKDFNYGAYLGNLLKNAPNIVWFTGNDYGSWPVTSDDTDVLAIAQGIKSTDPNHLQTLQLNGTISSSLDDQRWANQIDINGAYTYYPTYDEVLHAYNQTPTIPTFMEEANYEFENNTGGPATTDETLRRQEYWTATSGGNAGQLYGNCYTWDCSTNWADEQAHLDTPGVIQLQYMENLFTAREWFNLVPDQQHSFLTAGMGTYDSSADDVLQSDYATAAVTPDGGFGAVYVPTARTITVNLNLLAGNVTVRWFDPSNNTFVPVTGSPFAPGSGSQQFTTPGPNSEGNGDWLLVLDGNATADTTAPSTPSGVTVGGTTGSTVSLSWAPSSDNIGVASYRIFRNGTQVGTSTSTSFSDTGLANNTTYSYTVVAVDFAGNVSSPSAPVSATTTASPPPPSSPTFVQQNSVTPQNAQSTVAVSYAQPQTTGNLNVVVVGWYSTNATITSVTDSAGNTYAVAAPLMHSSQMYQAIYYAKNIGASAAGNVVTVKFSAAVQFADIRLAEYSGLDTVNPFDTTSSGTGSPATATSGNVTTSKPVELLVGAGETSGLFTAPGSGYTKRVITSLDGDILEDRVVTATGSYTATAAQSGDEVMQVVAFKAAGQ